jgi:ribosomal protein S6--L-glutamate ligase
MAKRSTREGRTPAPARPAAKPAAKKARKAMPSRVREPALTLAILSRKRSLYSTRRLLEAAQALGHPAKVLDTLRCDLALESGRPRVLFEGRELDPPGVVIPRIGASITRYGLAVVNQFEMMGVPALNGAEAIAHSRDKLRCLQFLARSGIPIPRTVMMRRREDVTAATDRVGGLPVIVKLLQGTQGVGVMIAGTHAELASILDTLWTLDEEILLQEFVAESRGRDIRALVAGNRVVAAMRRVARTKGEFRSNLHRGGAGEAVALPPAYAETAIRAARVLGLELAGVDMLESSDGPRVIEVNSSPGFEGLEKATRVDVARAIVGHAVAYARARAEGWDRIRP